MKTNTSTNIHTNKFIFTKLIKLTIIIFISLILQNCATADTTSPQSTKKVAGKDSKMSILMNNPRYYLRISKTLTKAIFRFNGETIYKSFNLNQFEIPYPINHFITSGKNTFSITLLAWEKQGYSISKKAKAKAELVLITFDGNEVVIAEIDFANNKITSSQSGTYLPQIDKTNKLKKYNTNAPASKVSQVETIKVSDIEIIPRTTYQATKVVGMTARLTVELQTPFPRWAYLDGEDIMQGAGEFYYIKGLGFENHKRTPKYYELKNRPDISELFDYCDSLLDMLRNNQVEKFVGEFKLKNDDMSIAYQSPTHDKLLSSVRENLADPELKLTSKSCRKKAVHISDTGKTIMLRGAFFFASQIENGLSSTYKVKFSRINGKWVITH